MQPARPAPSTSRSSLGADSLRPAERHQLVNLAAAPASRTGKSVLCSLPCGAVLTKGLFERRPITQALAWVIHTTRIVRHEVNAEGSPGPTSGQALRSGALRSRSHRDRRADDMSPLGTL